MERRSSSRGGLPLDLVVYLLHVNGALPNKGGKPMNKWADARVFGQTLSALLLIDVTGLLGFLFCVVIVRTVHKSLFGRPVPPACMGPVSSISPQIGGIRSWHKSEGEHWS